MLQIVGLGQMKTTNRKEDQLVTYSLGSCIGVSLYDPVAQVGGLAHCVLPLSAAKRSNPENTPCFYTDIGVKNLLQAVFDLGAKRNRLVAKVAGAGNFHGPLNYFEIGKRNYTVLKLTLWKNDILITSTVIGGASARTMILDMRTGSTTVKTTRNAKEI